jgi:hypothetical protein
MSFEMMLLVGFAFGIGFGFFVQRSGLCFAIGLGEIFLGRGKRILRMFTVIFVITSLGFLASTTIDPSLGLRPIGQIRGYGFLNVLSGMLFGAGILLNGGCILGTLRQIGEGNMLFLLVFISFIPGMALIVYGFNPLIGEANHVDQVLLPQVLGANPWAVTGTLAVACLIWLYFLLRDSKSKVSAK